MHIEKISEISFNTDSSDSYFPSPCGRYFAFTGWHKLCLWDIKTKSSKELFSSQEGHYIIDLLWSNDGKFIVFFDYIRKNRVRKYKLIFLNLETGKKVEIMNYLDRAWFTFSEDGRSVVLCKNNMEVNLFNMDTGACTKTAFISLPVKVDSYRVLHDKKNIFLWRSYCDSDPNFHEYCLLKVVKDDLVLCYSGQGLYEIFDRDIHFSRDEQKILSTSRDGAFKILDLKSGQAVTTQIPNTTFLISEFCDGVLPGTKNFVLVNKKDNDHISVWDVESGTCLYKKIFPFINGDGITSLCYLPGGYVALGMNQGDLNIYSTDTREIIQTIRTSNYEAIQNIRYSPKGKYIFLIYSEKIEVWRDMVPSFRAIMARPFLGHFPK